MPKYKAARNLTIGEPDKKHKHVKKGDHFDCSQDYHDDHLAPHGYTEESCKKPASKEDAKEDPKEEAKEHKKEHKKG